MYVCMPDCQKRAAPELTVDGCEPPCCYWELNSGPLKEESVSLIFESYLQPQNMLIVTMISEFSSVLTIINIYSMFTKKYGIF